MKFLHSRFRKVRVLVVGDLMLDEYLLGSVHRISPEAPVPVVEIKERRYVAGGAGNVAANVTSLGGQCSLVGVCGEDRAGERLRAIFDECGIDGSAIAALPQRPTTCKTRVVAGQQQIVRFDEEDRTELGEQQRAMLCGLLEEKVPDADVCVLSDYNKGVLSRELCQAVIGLARKRGVPVLVDPKGLQFDKYRGCTLITPNLRETSQFTGLAIDKEGDVIVAGHQLLSALAGSAVLVTRGPDGMTLFRNGQPPMTIPTVARTVFDVVGAGDTVMAALSVAVGAGWDFPPAMRFANIAAGIAVGRQGTVAVKLDEVLEHVEIAKLQEIVDGSSIAVDNETHLYSRT